MLRPNRRVADVATGSPALGPQRVMVSGSAAARIIAGDRGAILTLTASGESQDRRNISPDDLSYFAKRAEQELICAELASHPSAARAHSLLAGYYLDLIHRRAEAPSRLCDRQRPSR
jgi:hypothetical protein